MPLPQNMCIIPPVLLFSAQLGLCSLHSLIPSSRCLYLKSSLTLLMSSKSLHFPCASPTAVRTVPLDPSPSARMTIYGDDFVHPLSADETRQEAEQATQRISLTTTWTARASVWTSNEVPSAPNPFVDTRTMIMSSACQHMQQPRILLIAKVSSASWIKPACATLRPLFLLGGNILNHFVMGL